MYTGRIDVILRIFIDSSKAVIGEGELEGAKTPLNIWLFFKVPIIAYFVSGTKILGVDSIIFTNNAFHSTPTKVKIINTNTQSFEDDTSFNELNGNLVIFFFSLSW